MLCLNPKNDKYELFYGKRDQADSSPSETSLRECTEESANFFRFSKYMFERTLEKFAFL